MREHVSGVFARAPRRHRRRTAFWLLASRRLAVAVMEPTADEPLLIACAALAVERATASHLAPGVLETATAAGALGLPHVAALDDEWCALEPLEPLEPRRPRERADEWREHDAGGGAGRQPNAAWKLDVAGLDVRVSGMPPPGGDGDALVRRHARRAAWRRDGDYVEAAVRGGDGVRVVASRAAATVAVRRFAAARLRLVALDAAPCALLSLATYLGRAPEPDAVGASATARDLDPLTAVSVAPDCEQAAAQAGGALGVPVGLALARFGLVRDA